MATQQLYFTPDTRLGSATDHEFAAESEPKAEKTDSRSFTAVEDICTATCPSAQAIMDEH